MTLQNVNNNQQTTNLDGAHNDSVTTITVDSTTGFPSTNSVIEINSERVFYTGTTATTFTGCTRGYDGSTAASHSDNDEVAFKLTAKWFQDMAKIPVWVRHLGDRTADGETAHSDDQEFTGTIGGTEVKPSGNATWTQGKGVLSGIFDSNTVSDIVARMYDLTPTSSPVTIEAALRHHASESQYPMCGIVYSDGTATSDDVIAACWYRNNTSYVAEIRHGTYTNLGSAGSSISEVGPNAPMNVYLRLIWSASNTFKCQFSIDGAGWYDIDTSESKTLTPTKIGVFGSAYGSPDDLFVTFEYLRVTESDLSV